MTSCDMCGKQGELYRAEIEGTQMNVCRLCAKYGKVIKRVVPERYEKKKKQPEKKGNDEPKAEIIQVIRKGYGERIRQQREKMGLKQEELAKKISEKLSLIHKMESERFEPSITLARKLEHFLRIKLVEEQELKKEPHQISTHDQFTVGDFIKIKRR